LNLGARELANKGMKLTKRGLLGGSRHTWSGIMESRFAAYAPCSADSPEIAMNGPSLTG